jgi:broad specificity phosphatase PhoE
MKYILIRHGKTDANRLTRVNFGQQGALLNHEGIVQTAALHERLLTYDFDLATEPVAVSTLLRTAQTAQFAGLQNITAHPLLDEVKTPNPLHTQQLIENKQLPPEAIEAAKRILAKPPKARIWVTHGLVIAAVQHLLGTIIEDKFIIDFCGIVEIEL